MPIGWKKSPGKNRKVRVAMTIKKFLEDFQDLLQRDDPITMDTPLRDMEEWDSLAVMSCIAYLDKKFGVKTAFAAYKKLRIDNPFARFVYQAPKMRGWVLSKSIDP